MSQPKGYVDPEYLQVAAQVVQQSKQRSYTYMHVQPGQRLLDVGCGPATDTIISTFAQSSTSLGGDGSCS